MATLPAGTPVALQERPYARGPVAVRLGEDGRLLAKLRPPGAVLAEGEHRHSLHKCAKQERWREALSKSHAENRRRGQRYERKTPVVGVRKAGER